MALRSPHLHERLRCFCLAAFACLARDVERGADVPFAFEEHASAGRPSLYEYRPLVRGYVEQRERALRDLADARLALDELAREPAARIYARAHAGLRATSEQALFRTILLPLLERAAEACGGLDWKDDAFDRAYAELERSLFGDSRRHAAIAPLVGISAITQVELGEGVRVRPADRAELEAHWPEARGQLPPRFGREVDRTCVLEVTRDLPAREDEPPDSPGEVADAVTALRLATAAPLAAGPYLFERLDWRPYGIRPVLPIAAAQPPGEPDRLDPFRGTLAAQLLATLGQSDEDAALGEALDRWELSLFQGDPFRSESLRAALVALLGEGDGLFAAAARASLLLADSPRERADLLEWLRADPLGPKAADAVRRALVQTLLRGDRRELVRTLDGGLVGARAADPGIRDRQRTLVA